MIFSDWLRTVLANLNRMRGRVALTAFGVVIGTTAVMVLVSLGAGLQRSATGSLGNIANLKQISVMAQEGMGASGPGMVSSAGGGKPAAASRRPPGLTTQGLADLAAIPGVSGVVALEEARFDMLQYRQLQGFAPANGVTAGALEKLGLEAESGSLTPGRGQVVVGARVHENFWDAQRGQPGQVKSLLGETLTLVASKYDQNTGESSTRTWRFLVAGVLKESGESDYQMYMPQRDAETVNEWVLGSRINRNKDGYQSVIVVVEDSQDVLAIQTQILDMGFGAYSAMDAVSEINSFFGVLQAVLGSIGAIALLVAALGIVNTLSMAILERTREIGLMKAVGARNRDVMLIFLGEAAIIGFLGGVFGAVLGWMISGAANLVIGGLMQQSGSGGGLFGGPSDSAAASIVYTPFWLPIFAIVFATLIGLVSGVYPALRAATLDPLRALKYE